MAILIENLARSLQARFPRKNYGFADAIRRGRLDYDNGNLRLRNNTPVASFDCASASHEVYQRLAAQGVSARICRIDAPVDIRGNAAHKIRHIVVTAESDGVTQTVGLTPYDNLLGIFPVHRHHGDTIFAGIMSRFGTPFDGAFLRNLRDPADFEFSTRIPVGATIFTTRPVILGATLGDSCLVVANLAIVLRGEDQFFLQFSAERTVLTGGNEVPFQVSSQIVEKVGLSRRDLAKLRCRTGDKDFDFRRFRRWLDREKDEIAYFSRVDFNVPEGSPERRTLSQMLEVYWPVVAIFLNKLPREITKP